MLRDEINTYRPTIDPQFSEDGQELGINLISNVKNPAVKIKGVAFSNHEVRELRFKDDIKLRIAAPVLVPGKIYRDDEDEKYFMEFTKEDIEEIAKDFMSRLPTKSGGVFNLEHENQMVDSYILEAILADSEAKVNMIRESYAIELPMGSFLIVQQFTDRALYEDIVQKDATSFSFEGFMGTKLVKEYKFKNDKMTKNLKLSKMSKPKKVMGVKRVYMSASKKLKLEEVAENEELIVIAEDFKEGAEVVVIEDVVEGGVEDFTGEVDVTVEGKEETLIIDKGVITEIVEAEVEATEETVEVEMEEEVKEEEMEEETVVVEPTEEAPATNELEEIYKMLADIKAELAELKSSGEVEVIEEDEHLIREQKYAASLTSFNTFMKKR